VTDARPPVAFPSVPEDVPLSSQPNEYLIAATSWLDQHVDLLLPDPDETAFDRDLLQRTGEFALLYRALQVSPVEVGHTDAWRGRLTRYVESEYLVEMARKSLHISWAWLMPYFILSDVHGLSIAEHELTMRYSLESGLPHASEVVPYRRLDQHYFLGLSTNAALDPYSLIGDTFLSRFTNLLWIDRESAYSLTHTLFYVNDFGLRELHRDHPAHAKVAATLESLLPQYARNGDWDVLGELLIAAIRTEGLDRTLVAEYLEMFRAQRDSAGFTPPSLLTNEALDPNASRDVVFEACYHTTLIAALLEVAVASSPAGPVQSFTVGSLISAPLPQLMEQVLDARNRAVEYLNQESLDGREVRIVDEPHVAPLETWSSRADLATQDRNVVLAHLLDGSYRPIAEYSLELAECFAREGDIELVLHLIRTALADRKVDERVSALLEYAIHSQKPNGSVGYFAHEARLLGAADLGDIRRWLTHLFVEATDAWLDRQAV
jgi:hypothetical protein